MAESQRANRASGVLKIRLEDPELFLDSGAQELYNIYT